MPPSWRPALLVLVLLIVSASGVWGDSSRSEAATRDSGHRTNIDTHARPVPEGGPRRGGTKNSDFVRGDGSPEDVIARLLTEPSTAGAQRSSRPSDAAAAPRRPAERLPDSARWPTVYVVVATAAAVIGALLLLVVCCGCERLGLIEGAGEAAHRRAAEDAQRVLQWASQTGPQKGEAAMKEASLRAAAAAAAAGMIALQDGTLRTVGLEERYAGMPFPEPEEAAAGVSEVPRVRLPQEVQTYAELRSAVLERAMDAATAEAAGGAGDDARTEANGLPATDAKELRSALIRRAMADLRLELVVRNAYLDVTKHIDGSTWTSVGISQALVELLNAQRLLEEELLDVIGEAMFLKPGWGASILQEASALVTHEMSKAASSSASGTAPEGDGAGAAEDDADAGAAAVPALEHIPEDEVASSSGRHMDAEAVERVAQADRMRRISRARAAEEQGAAPEAPRDGGDAAAAEEAKLAKAAQEQVTSLIAEEIALEKARRARQENKARRRKARKKSQPLDR